MHIPGTIIRIDDSFLTAKNTPILEFAFAQDEDNDVIYPQIHHNLEILHGFQVGDRVDLNCKLYGKEKITETKKTHYHAIVVSKIELL